MCAQGDGAPDVGLGAIGRPAECDLARWLIGEDIPNECLAAGRDRALRKALALRDGDARAGKEACRDMDGEHHQPCPSDGLRSARDVNTCFFLTERTSALRRGRCTIKAAQSRATPCTQSLLAQGGLPPRQAPSAWGRRPEAGPTTSGRPAACGRPRRRRPPGHQRTAGRGARRQKCRQAVCPASSDEAWSPRTLPPPGPTPSRGRSSRSR
mmetsp:Transcript_27000/g.84395  ORF Transcript_27000/g.84395 Transcript_27000/m.84395 type:complete len:211 (-) Transcript_27000:1990-2622(-)